jgi:hypothetical protein
MVGSLQVGHLGKKRHKGTKAQRHKAAKKEAKGRRCKGTKQKDHSTLSLCIFVPFFLCAYVPLFLGSMRVKVLPCPEALVTAMSPWWARAKALARLRPRPVPG